MTTPSSEQDKLVRVLARGDVLALAFGAMIGWGWIVLTGTAIQSAGSVGAILAFIIGGLAIIMVGLTYAELASAMPKVGGEHVYSYRALGHLPSFLCTWAIILGYLSVVAFEAVALPTVIEHLAPNYAVGHLWTIAGWEVKATWVAVGVGGLKVHQRGFHDDREMNIALAERWNLAEDVSAVTGVAATTSPIERAYNQRVFSPGFVLAGTHPK